ncbi:MAG: hypothetical protein H6807_10545 [Planctomycetes bacterium]|nr:hypothetical protein [Planctomycetota bacterium]
MRALTTMFLALLLLGLSLRGQQEIWIKDVDVAIDRIAEVARPLIESKKIDWPGVGAEFRSEVRKVTSDAEHWRLLVRLLARLRDGHAEVRPLGAAKGLEWPDEGPPYTGSGLLLGRARKGIYVRGVFAGARDLGIENGWEVLEVDGKKVEDWLAGRIATFRDLMSFSSDQHAEFFALQRGMIDREGAAWEIQFKTPKGKKTTKTLRFVARTRQVPEGPVAYPGDPKAVRVSKEGNVRWTRLDKGLAYVHVRRSPGSVVDELDEALAELADTTRGLVLDYRNNTGGGFDHEAFMGRFIPEDKELRFVKRYRGQGPKRYGGPIVVIVDGTTVSAGETGAGMFMEDGRAYLIGESPTAGMSSQKTTIELPSGRFGLYVSTHSNMLRFNQGRGIEGLGVLPQEILPLDPKDLARNEDTLINRALALLRRFPQKMVPYDPKDFGWK